MGATVEETEVGGGEAQPLGEDFRGGENSRI